MSDVALVETKKPEEPEPIVHRVASEPLDTAADMSRCQKLLEVLEKSPLLTEEQRSGFCSFLAGFHDVFSLEDGE